MTEKTLRKDRWEAAGYAGLALGLVSTLYMYVNNILGTSNASVGVITLISVPLWIAKFVACILLMKFFMKKFYASHTEISDKDLYRMGATTALLSAFFFSSLQFIDMSYLSVEFYASQYKTIMQQYSSVMDSNSLSMLEKFMDRVPQLTFVWTLIYCTAFGTILSSILSRTIISKDPFADYKPE